MSTVARPAPQPGPIRIRRQAYEVSAYERLASMLMSLLVLLGLIVFCLLVAWLSTRVFFEPMASPPVRIEQVGGGTSDGIVGESMQMDSPTHEDIARESDMTEPELQDTITAVIDAIAEQKVDLDDPSVSETDTEKKGGAQQIGTGNKSGYGFGPGRPGIPPHMRWEILFESGSTVEDYAKILDFFGIELGILSGGGQVIYLNHLVKARPDTRTGATKDDLRLYMSWRQGKMMEADYELLRRAGVRRAKVLQFYSDALEQQLLNLEVAFAGREPGTIRKTKFAIKREGAGYVFQVVDQIPLVR